MSESRIRDALDAFAADLRVPAVVGGIVSSDGTTRTAVTGVRRRDASTPAAISDRWHIGSCGKSISAALYGALVDRAVCRWDAAVPDLFPDLEERIHPAWRERSVEEVFHCRSGMPANPERAVMRAGLDDLRPLTQQRTEVTISALSRPPARRGRFVYSNLGYVVIGAAIDRLAGVPFEDALRCHLFEPLGLRSPGYGPPPEVWGHGPRLQLGSLCLLRGSAADPRRPTSDNPRFLSSAGTLHLTLPDWLAFIRQFLAGGDGVLRAETIERLMKPPRGPGTPMAMGWTEARGLPGVSVGMQGSNTMWSATAVLNEARTLAAAVVANDGRTRVLMRSAKLAAGLLQNADNSPPQ
ncbi:MAG: serine hydrolase domain-containing protein [Pseudomonadales bacterium]